MGCPTRRRQDKRMSLMYQGRIIRVKGKTNVKKLLYEMKIEVIHIMILMKRWMMLR